MRFSRENAIGAEHRFYGDSLQIINKALVTQYESLPIIFQPFSSLLLFMPSSDTSLLVINNVSRSYTSLTHDILLLFVGITFLHLPNISNKSKIFPLSIKAHTLFSSAEVLVAVLKAAGFITRSLYTPIVGPELHRQAPLILDNIQNSMSGANIPSPGLATIESAQSLYIIGSCGALVAKQNAQFKDEILELLNRCFIPCLQKIGFVKPMANKYVQKLKALL